MKSRSLPIFIACLTSVFAINDTADADIFAFFDRPTWEAFVGTPDTGDDFEAFVADLDFSFSTTSAPNGFSMTHSGPVDFRNLIDVAPFDFPDGNGSNDMSLFVEFEGGDVVTLTPDQAASGIGFDVSSAAGGEGVFVDVLDTSGSVLATSLLTNGIDDFFGFATTGEDSIGSLFFYAASDNPGSGGEGFRIDNVAIRSIPEPGSFVVFGLVLPALLLARRRTD